MKKLILLMSVASCINLTNAQSWQTVGSAGFSPELANTLAIAIDGSNTPYVLYGDGGVDSNKANVVKYDGSSWVPVGNAGFSASGISFSAMAIDPSGAPYVSYYDAAYNGKATVMKYDGSSWVNVGSPGFSAGEAPWTSIAFDGGGTPYVTYSDNGTNGKATVMKYNGSSWVPVGGSPGISTGAVSFTTIAIDGSGTPYVAYCDVADSQKATVMKYNGSSWVTVGSAGFSAGEAHYTSIAIDTGGIPYVVYSDYGNGQKATLMKYNGTAWVAVGGAGFSLDEADYTVLAIDHSNTPYVVYEDYGRSNKATVMKYDGSSWVNVGSAGFSPSFVFYTSIAIDGSGTPYVLFDDGSVIDKATVMKYNIPAPPPVASFQSTETTICADKCISFTDLSANATSWQWSFAGALDSTSTAQNPQSICYQTAGNYNVTLIASNSAGSDTVTYSNYITVNPAPPVPVAIQHQDTLFCSTNALYTSYQWYLDSAIINGATDTSIVISQPGNYNVQVSNSSGCSVAVGINIVLGLENYASINSITLSPNPVEKEFTVYGLQFTVSHVEILNVLGEVCSQSKIINRKSKIEADVSSLSSGIYFIKIDGENSKWIGKFIKE